MQRFLAGFLVCLALGGYVLWVRETYLSKTAIRERDAACTIRVSEAINAARAGYVLPIPVTAPPEFVRPPTHRVPVKLPPTARPSDNVDPRLPPPGVVTSPELAAPGGGVDSSCVCFTAGSETTCSPPGCLPEFRCDPPDCLRVGYITTPGLSSSPTVDTIPNCGTLGVACDVDLRGELVRASATADVRNGENVLATVTEPCRVTRSAVTPSVPLIPASLPPRWFAEFRAGLGTDGWATGASAYGRSRVGGWVQATHGRREGGIAIRFGPVNSWADATPH